MRMILKVKWEEFKTKLEELQSEGNALFEVGGQYRRNM